MLAEIRTRITEDLLARRIDRWVTGTIAVLLVVVGFLAGRWTSHTSNATPIVFQEAPGGGPVTAEALRALVAGTEDLPSLTPAPRAAGAAVRPLPPEPPVPLGSLVASANGKKYYLPSCKEVRRIKEENLVWFDSEEEAKESGYEPSKCVQGR